LIAEVTTSWSYVGAGLRLSTEVLGPEYSMSINTLESGLKLFFSRRVQGTAGEDLVEKQNAEQGLMPVVPDETAEYGYEAENRYFVNCFRDGKQPEESFYDGLAVTQLLMTAYHSAEVERTVSFDPDALNSFVPAVAARSLEGMIPAIKRSRSRVNRERFVLSRVLTFVGFIVISSVLCSDQTAGPIY
jgi:hypothetical protein